MFKVSMVVWCSDDMCYTAGMFQWCNTSWKCLWTLQKNLVVLFSLSTSCSSYTSTKWLLYLPGHGQNQCFQGKLPICYNSVLESWFWSNDEWVSHLPRQMDFCFGWSADFPQGKIECCCSFCHFYGESIYRLIHFRASLRVLMASSIVTRLIQIDSCALADGIESTGLK